MNNDQILKSYAEGKLRKLPGGSLKARVLVIIADFVILNLLLLVLFYGNIIPIPKFFDSATKVCVLVANFAMVVAQYFFHTIVDKRLLTTNDVVKQVLKLSVTQFVIMGVAIRLLSNTGGLFQFMVVFSVSESIILVLSRIAEKAIIDHYRSRGMNTRTVLFVGNDPSLRNLYLRFTEIPSVGYKVLGYYADKRMTDEPEGLNWLGDIATLNRKFEKWNNNVMVEPGVEELFCSISHSQDDEIKFIMHSCDRNIIHFFYVPRAFGNDKLRLKPFLTDTAVLYSNRVQPLLIPTNRLIKRVFDVIISSIVCLFLIPLTLIIGFIIKIQSPGPVFFKQLRTGLDGHDFYCYKFRSMHVNKEADTQQATKDDPRKFPFGNFMRKANIDELPQFFNVLKGDMSIVGPRPHMLHHTEEYGKLIDNYMVRLFCKPGITGWAQVTGFRGETKELWQMQGRVERDIWYVENWSLGLDIRIILKTAKSIFVHDENAF